MGRLAAVLFLLLVFLLTGCSPPPGACPFDGPPNPSGCPATWAEARGLCSGSARSCSPAGLSCYFAGAGDQVGDCFAPGNLACIATDAGQAEWRCAQ